MCVYLCVCVCVCVCVICHCTVYNLFVLFMSAQIRVWSCLVTDNFGLFAEITVCKFSCSLAVVWPKTFLFCYVCIHFSASFCTVHCALDLA